jgi:hypothetical protein
MEHKKLIKILLKDMGELEELISDVKTKGNLDDLEMEFIHTRAKGIMQLLRLLDNKINKISETTLRELQKEKPDGHVSDSPEIKEPDDNFDREKREEEELPSEKIPESREVVNSSRDNHSVINGHKEVNISDSDDNQDDDEMLGEDDGEGEEHTRLGDSFLKGKSVNDIITEQQKLEFKLSNRPVTSIKTAIGINDRFQYIRELFDNSALKFTDTVENLDSMDNIHDAVNYLRNNFKWKKNDTSLKFVNLVKRRFMK